jgi:DNA polymerase I-like protein with 3'-5' exonuclease and polymerase domains
MEVVNGDFPKTGIRIDKKTASSLVNLYHQEFYLIPEWHRAIQAELGKGRTLRNPFGRRRTFFGRWSDELFRMAYSWKPQSAVADRINTSLVKIDRELKDIRLLVQVHDALLAEIPEGTLDDVVTQMKPLLEEPFFINGDVIKIPCEFKWGRNWGPQTKDNPDGLRKYKKE